MGDRSKTGYQTAFFAALAAVAGFVAIAFTTRVADAAPRLIVVPGQLGILIMEGVSSSGEDAEPQRLFNAIAMPSIQRPDGDGKLMATGGNEFSLTCGEKHTPVYNIVCTITVKPSPHSKLGFNDLEFETAGADAQQLNEKLAGKAGSFLFDSVDHKLHIESTAERFLFSYRQ